MADQNNQWEIPLTGDYLTKTETETARIFLDQAEKELAVTEKIREGMSSKAVSLIGIAIPSIAAILAVIAVVRPGAEYHESHIFWGATAISAMWFISALGLMLCVFPKKYADVGYSPERLISQDLIFNLGGEVQTVNLIYQICKWHQDSIRENDIQNRKMAKKYKVALWILAISPFVGIAFGTLMPFVIGLLCRCPNSCLS